MSEKSIQEWVDTALQQMKFPPDRERVRQELLDHLEDRQQDFLNRGLTIAEAEEKALTAMGNAVETGKLLDAAHTPLLGWAWLISKVLCILIGIVLSVYFLMNDPLDVLGRIRASLFLDEPCTMLEYYEEYDLPYTLINDEVIVEVGDYTMKLDHGFYASHEPYSYEVYLGWQVWSRKPWLEFPKGLFQMTVEDSFGNVWTDTSSKEWNKPHAEFYFNTTGGILPVWRFHMELLYLHDNALPEWLKVTIPETNAGFTIYMDGEVRP